MPFEGLEHIICEYKILWHSSEAFFNTVVPKRTKTKNNYYILHNSPQGHAPEPHSHPVPSLEEQRWMGTVMAAHVGSQEPVQLYRKKNHHLITTLKQNPQDQKKQTTTNIWPVTTIVD